MQIDFPAHINHQMLVQSVQEHCRNTAQYAEACLKSVGLGKTAYLAGLVHDCGKFTLAFKNYIEASARGENVRRGSVNHTFAGVKLLLDRYHHDMPKDINDFASEIIAYAVGAHHGLFDCMDKDKKNGFLYRQSHKDINYEEAEKNFFKYCATESEIDELFQQSVKEIETFIQNLLSFCCCLDEGNFYYSMLCRLVLAAVIEGDRKDTSEFMYGIEYAAQQADWNVLLHNTENKLQAFAQDTEIAQARSIISQKCCDSANNQPGIYKLNVPTGGGKTLASLRYALKHAAIWKKQRIIYVMPLLSIIEQNAAVLREYLEDDNLILEHHSNFLDTKESNELDERELLLETWEAPVIITTLVQLLHTLFKSKPASIRRFKSLCNSIIIFDEVQTVPTKLLTLFNLACNFLSKLCGCTIILCSATQPCLEKTAHPINGTLELITLDDTIKSVFNRVEIIDKGHIDYIGLEKFVSDAIAAHPSVLVICNTKAEANRIFAKVKEYTNNNLKSFYLSANMCAEHRKDTIKELKKALAQKEKTVCVSTQVIEAGVDVSFACVIRLCAGLDSIIQAAGRCNRHGELNVLAPVYIVELLEENLSKLPDMEKAKNAAMALLVERRKENSMYQNLIDNASVNFFYHKLFHSMDKGYHDYYCKDLRVTIFAMLSENKGFIDNTKQTAYTSLHQAFKTAGENFEVFEQDTVDIIVPYENGKAVISNILSNEGKYNIYYLKEQLNASKGYRVAVLRYQLQQLKDSGAAIQIEDIYLLNENFYDKQTGLVMDPHPSSMMH